MITYLVQNEREYNYLMNYFKGSPEHVTWADGRNLTTSYENIAQYVGDTFVVTKHSDNATLTWTEYSGKEDVKVADLLEQQETVSVKKPAITKRQAYDIETYKSNVSTSVYCFLDDCAEADGDETTLALAFLIGYTIKEDQKWYLQVLDNKHGYVNRTRNNSGAGEVSLDTKQEEHESQTMFTQSEIDNLQMHFPYTDLDKCKIEVIQN